MTGKENQGTIRRQQGIKTKSINLALSVVRRILNLASRLWRDENGLTWLDTPPLIQMLPVTDARPPYPLSWEEQRTLFRGLTDHLARMALFKVNTGCREQEVCQLKWDWEVRVSEMETSVFIVPGERVKLGHRNGDITTHYSAPELEELIAAVNKVCEEKSGAGYIETRNGRRVMHQPFDNYEDFWRAWHDSKRMAAPSDRLVRRRYRSANPLILKA